MLCLGSVSSTVMAEQAMVSLLQSDHLYLNGTGDIIREK